MDHPWDYRPRQFFLALAARRRVLDDAPARRVLPPALLALFQRMPPEDRRHALTVLADLEARGDADPILLQAGLLHDLGKTGAGVGLPHRVARVLVKSLAPRVWAWMIAQPTGWRRPFWVVAHHPARGAVWAESQGADPAVVDLIRFHESPPPAAWAGTPMARRHAALAWADARS